MSVTRVDLNREQEAHARTREALENALKRPNVQEFNKRAKALAACGEALACASAREAALRDTIKDLQGEVTNLKRSAEQARMTAAKVMNDFDALKEKADDELKRSKAQTAEAKDMAKAFERKVDALARDLDAAKAALAQTQKALDASEEKAAALAGKVERAEIEKQRANESVSDLLTSTIKLNAEHSALTLKFNSMTKWQDQILMALKDAQSKERAMKSEIANLKARLAVRK